MADDAGDPAQGDAIALIEDALIRLVRRTNDPRGNSRINRRAGVDIERSGSVLLARIEEMEPVRLGDLAEAVGIDTSTASRQVARLVDDGYVDREPDPLDGRASVHRLSPDGRKVRQRLAEVRREWFEERLADFSADERRQFAHLFQRFITGIENDR